VVCSSEKQKTVSDKLSAKRVELVQAISQLIFPIEPVQFDRYVQVIYIFVSKCIKEHGGIKWCGLMDGPNRWHEL